jgi:hypothetical protein
MDFSLTLTAASPQRNVHIFTLKRMRIIYGEYLQGGHAGGDTTEERSYP